MLPDPHQGQIEVLKNRKRFNLLKCGRRWGKTFLVVYVAAAALMGLKVGIWLPTYKDLEDLWNRLKAVYKPTIISKKEGLHIMRLAGGGVIEFWSMENPDSGRGRDYDVAIIDEAAKAKKLKPAWEETIRGTLVDREGEAWILSTPKGKSNYFFKLRLKVKDNPNWAVWTFTSYENPHLPEGEIEQAKGELDPITFRQEYLAEDVDLNESPYLYSFDSATHIIHKKDYRRWIWDRNLPLKVSFDFNKDPITAIVGQQPSRSELVIFNEISISNGSTPEICERILALYPRHVQTMRVTGDATGRNRTAMVRGNVNHYTLIKEKLNLERHQFQVRKTNLSHENSRVLCNSVLANAKVRITDNCVQTINDCQYAAVDNQGRPIKTEDEGRHFFDNVRYLIDMSFPEFISDPEYYTPMDQRAAKQAA